MLSFLIVGVVITAQDANLLKNDGNAALREKNYVKAHESYLKALELQEAENIVDTPLYYNAGYCAYKTKAYENAIELLSKSAEFKYKGYKSYLFLSDSYKKCDELEKAEETILKGMEEYPNEAKLKNQAAKIYLTMGLVYYNEGNKIKKAANESGMNVTDIEKFKAEYVKADERFEKSLPIFEKAYQFDKENEKVIKALKNVYNSLKMTDKADAL